MFHRIFVEQWQHVLTITSFAIFFSSFVLTLIRLWRMPRTKVEHMEKLPLQSDANE
jgi:hypothetical protein